MNVVTVPSAALSLSPPAPSRLWRLPWLTPRVCRLLFAALLLVGFFSHIRYLARDCPIDLSGDEAQYWDWSRQLDWSYYSKGPLVAYIIRASCWAFGRDTMFTVRFPAVVLGIGTSVVTYLLTRKLFGSDRLALGAVLLYLVVPMFAAGSVLMTIDPPFFFCWALATYLAAHAVFDGRKWAWPLIGVAAGIGFLAKYAMLLWFLPLVLFLATDRAARPTLRSVWPWLALGVAALFLTPVVVWNAQHGWVSVRHVATQTGSNSAGKLRIANVFEMVGGQFAIVGPGIFVLMVAAVLYAIRPHHQRRAPDGRKRPFWPRQRVDGPEPFVRQMRFLMWFGVTFFAVNFLWSFRTKIQLNWPVPAYFTLMILTAYFLSTRLHDRRAWKGWRWWFYPAVAFGLLAMPIAHDVEILYPAIRWMNTHAAAWRQRKDNRLLAWLGKRLGKNGIEARQADFTAKLKGWAELGNVLSNEVEQMGPGSFVLCDDYQQTAEAAFYMRGQPRTYYMGSYYKGDPKRWTQYDLWPDRTLEPPNARVGRNAVYVGHADRPLRDLLDAFERVEGVTVVKDAVVDGQYVRRPEQRAIVIDVMRAGVPVRQFRYFRCFGFKGISRAEGKSSY